MSFKLKGKYNQATVHTDNVNQETIGQIIQMCNIESLSQSTIHIMPDCHKAKDCVVGTALTYTDSIIPAMVGTDIGCGMLLTKVKKQAFKHQSFSRLNHFLKMDIAKVYSTNRGKDSLLQGLITPVENNILQSFATLGSGNHFIELSEDDEYTYIVIHTGSRWLGTEVAQFHINKAFKQNDERLPLATSHLTGHLMDDYLHDLIITQRFSSENRLSIMERILKFLQLEDDVVSIFQSEHNYVDTKEKILHKGSCSAKKGEQVIIPINMRDGSLIGIGTGNEDWNFSTPHGAGRLYTRSESKEILSLDEFKQQMNHIWSSSVNQSMISESPNAYKPLDEIQENIKESVEITHLIKPIYNFKNN